MEQTDWMKEKQTGRHIVFNQLTFLDQSERTLISQNTLLFILRFSELLSLSFQLNILCSVAI